MTKTAATVLFVRLRDSKVILNAFIVLGARLLIDGSATATVFDRSLIS